MISDRKREEIRKEAKIVKRKNWLFGKPATEDEAVEQMELLSHDWFIFKNKKMTNTTINLLTIYNAKGILFAEREER